MFNCKECNSVLILLESGGCGGFGTLVGCERCDSIFRQTTGGIVATPGGERWKKQSYTLTKWRNGQKSQEYILLIDLSTQEDSKKIDWDAVFKPYEGRIRIIQIKETQAHIETTEEVVMNIEMHHPKIVVTDPKAYKN